MKFIYGLEQGWILLFRPKRMRFSTFLWPILLTFIVLFWHLMTDVWQIADRVLVPSPRAVFNVFINDWKWMLEGAIASISRLLIAFLVAIPSAVYLGVWAGWTPFVRQLLYPPARVLSPIPPIIYSPFLVALLPSFQMASMTMLIIGIFWPTFLALVHRLDHIEEEILVPAMMLELKSHSMVHAILLPYVWPGVLNSCRTLLSSSFMLLAFSEMMGASSGLGFYVRYFADYGNYANVIAGIIATVVVIFLLNAILVVIEKVAVPWRPNQ